MTEHAKSRVLKIKMRNGQIQKHPADAGGRLMLCFSSTHLALFDGINFCFWKEQLKDIKALQIETDDGDFMIGRRKVLPEGNGITK